MNIEIRDTAVTKALDGKKIIQAKRPPGKKTTYRVNVEIVGDDTPFIKKVTYILHPTFKNRIKTVSRMLSNPNCAIAFYAWGIFNIEAKVEFMNGSEYSISHFLRFNEDIQSGKYNIVYI